MEELGKKYICYPTFLFHSRVHRVKVGIASKAFLDGIIDCGVKVMATVGMIEMACYCGARLFYVGNQGTNQPPLDIIEKLKAKVNSGDIGYFSSADGSHGDCPFCGLTYELPDPEIMDWLPYLDKEQFTSTINDIQRSSFGKNGQQLNPPSAHRYLL